MDNSQQISEISKQISTVWSQISTIWTTLFSSIGGIVVYCASGVIWAVRLGGKVQTQKELFNMFLEHSKEKDKKLDESIEKLFEYQRELDKTISKIARKEK
jgi:hypothetical protein